LGKVNSLTVLGQPESITRYYYVMYAFVSDRQFDPCPLVVAFDGWVDAASVGSSVAAHLATGAMEVVEFDSDEVFDYRANRPVVDFVAGRLSDLTLPQLSIAFTQPGSVPLMVMQGTEPGFRWKALGEAMVDITRRIETTELICIGAVPSAVPHTRPTRIMATSSVDGFVSDDAPPGLLRVPGAAVTNLEWHLAQSGLPTYGFWAQIPHYVTGPYPQAMVALIERVGCHLGRELPLGDLPSDAMRQRSELDEMARENSEMTEHLKRLESLTEPQDIPTAEELGSEIEDFLRGEE
jgi:hypothetical protein